MTVIDRDHTDQPQRIARRAPSRLAAPLERTLALPGPPRSERVARHAEQHADGLVDGAGQIAVRPRVQVPAKTRLTIMAPEPVRLGTSATSCDERVDLPPPAPSRTRSAGLFAYAVRRDNSGRLRLAAGWPLWALLVLFPVWWALGLGSFIFPLLAIPMIRTLAHRRPLRYPRGWLLWALFLGWVLFGLVMFAQNPAGTHAGSFFGRVISYVVLISNYASVTALLLFVGNLTAAELPVNRIVRWLGALLFTTVAGGLLGTFAPHFAFTSPVELVIPGSLRTDPYISALIHPAAAQVQSVLGTESGRAAAPFAYTNFWANNVSLLLIWFVCGWAVGASTRRKLICLVTVCAATVPIIYSLNRGLWIGIAVTIVWAAVRLFLHGRVAALLSVLVAVSLGGLIFILTPLHTTLTSRLAHPESNSIRAFLTAQAVKGATESPILGWGGTRKTNGSAQSITVGKSAKCPQCGEFTIGSNGQLWGVLFYQGFVGAAFYFSFFGFCIWTYRRDRSPIGQAGVIAIALTFVYMLFYNALPASLAITMISVGLLWRSDDEQLAARPALRHG